MSQTVGDKYHHAHDEDDTTTTTRHWLLGLGYYAWLPPAHAVGRHVRTSPTPVFGLALGVSGSGMMIFLPPFQDEVQVFLMVRERNKGT